MCPGVKHAIDFRGLVAGSRRFTVLKIALAAGLDLGHIRVHDHVFCSGQLLDRRASRAVVPMRVADEENLNVAELKSQFFDAVANQRDGGFETAVDEDVALRRGNQVGGEALAPDVVDISDDAIRRERVCPVRSSLCEGTPGKHEREKQ